MASLVELNTLEGWHTINKETSRKLHEIRLTSMIEALEAQEYIENIHQMNFEDRLELLIDLAYNTR